MKRVLVLVPFPMPPDLLANRQAQGGAVDPGVELTYRSVRAAPASYTSQHDAVLADVGLLEAGLSAEAEGFDAVCIDTVSDSGVDALRSVLDIPVIGPGRAMFATALMLGSRFGVLTMWEDWFPLYTKTLTSMRLRDRCAGMRAAGIAPDNRALLAGKEDEVFPALLAAARLLIDDDGADVICLGSTTMHEAHGFLRERLEVPVLNPGPLSYRHAEILTATGLRHSRRSYPTSKRPKPDLIEAMLDAVEDHREASSR
ncbi:MAG: aspartate/glutamate racemase family protein [Acidimicrobiia bacterium]|nr:aspartate/glutamate racemase family protein [Acidimicrobiia bacterium]